MTEQLASQTETPASSAPPSPTERLAQMSETERTAWKQTGAVPGVEVPIAEPEREDAESDTLDEAPPALEPPAPEPPPAAASEAGKTLAKRKKDAQQVINELSRSNFLLKGELNAWKELHNQSPRPAAAVEPQQPSPSPLPPGFSFPTFDQWLATYPDRTYEDYMLAGTAAYVAFDRQQTAAAAQESHIVSTFQARVAAFKADKPDYDAVTSNPEAFAMAHPYMHRAIAESEHGPAIAYFLGSHLEECRRLASQPTTTAFDRHFGRLEAQIERDATASASPASTTNHVTQAPAPPPTLGSRPVVPGDEVDAAVRRKDPGEYMRVMNARELAARGR